MARLPSAKFVSVAADGDWFGSLVRGPAEIMMRIMAGREVADRASLDRAMQRLLAMVDAEARLLPRGLADIFLVGYSQGGMVSLHTALLGGRSLGGVAVMNSAVPLLNLERLPEESVNVPIIHFHGTQDNIVPVQLARMGHTAASAAGCRSYEFVERPGSHDPSSGVTASVTAWLVDRIQS
jgi:phospholipase/carboxylesterase